jgi:hypothetical protein
LVEIINDIIVRRRLVTAVRLDTTTAAATGITARRDTGFSRGIGIINNVGITTILIAIVVIVRNMATGGHCTKKHMESINLRIHL